MLMRPGRNESSKSLRANIATNQTTADKDEGKTEIYVFMFIITLCSHHCKEAKMHGADK
jgi:hypothetical protein